jgi:hypothetical protein
MLLCAVPSVVLPSLHSAYAQNKEAEDASDEGGDGEEDTKAPDPTQPIVEAGGNYSQDRTPQNEVDRTLLEAEGGLELRLDWHADLRKDVEFKTHVFELLARYGVSQTNEARAGLDFMAAAPEGVDKVSILRLEDEQALVFDLLDVRAGLAVAFGGGDTIVDIVAGIPFKYRITNKIAILGLERIIAIHAAKPDGASGTPDLNFSLTGELQIIPKLVIYVKPGIFLGHASGDEKDLSVEVGVQYTVAPAIDIGFRLLLDQLTPPSTSVSGGTGAVAQASAIDARSFAFYIRGRLLGK